MRSFAPFVLGVICVAFNNPGCAQFADSLARDFTEFADNLAQLPSPASISALVSVGTKALAPDISKDALEKAVSKFTSEGKVRNLRSQLQRTEELSEDAVKGEKTINVNLSAYPDFSHLNYCAQVTASERQIASTKDSISNLRKLRDAAGRYLNVLPALDELVVVFRNYWDRVADLAAAYDSLELTSFGTMQEQQIYFSADPGQANDGAVSALSHSWQNWQAVQTESLKKLKSLEKLLSDREAFHSLYYTEASKKCDANGQPISVSRPVPRQSDQQTRAPIQQAPESEDQTCTPVAVIDYMYKACPQDDLSPGNACQVASCMSETEKLCGNCGFCVRTARRQRDAAQQLCR
jgi:hypothetical protein